MFKGVLFMKIQGTPEEMEQLLKTEKYNKNKWKF